MPERLGTLLQVWRTERGFTLRGLALKSGVGKSTLAYWEAGSRQPSVAELETVLQALRATPSERMQAYSLLSAPRGLRRIRELSPLSVPTVGDLLRAMRNRQGWSQSRLADLLGVRQSTVTRWERAEMRPEGERFDRLCTVLEASPEERAALKARHLLEVAEAGGHSGASPAAQFESLRSEVWSGLAGPGDLRFLILEARLTSTLRPGTEALVLLARTYALHAAWLSFRGRLDEAVLEAQRSLDLVAQETPAAPDWLWAAHLLAKHRTETGRHPSPLEGLRILQRWASAAEPWCEYRHWFRRNTAEYLCMAGAVRSALDLSRQVYEEALMGEGPDRHDRLSRAQILLRCGSPEVALSFIPDGVDGLPVQRLNEAFTRVEVLFCLGEREAAQVQLDAAHRLITAEALWPFRDRAERLSRLL